MTFIRHLSEHVSGDMEEVDIRTIAVKNIEVHSALVGVQLPAEVRRRSREYRACVCVCCVSCLR